MNTDDIPFGDENELFNEACQQFWRDCEEMSPSPDVPSRSDSEVNVWTGIVELRNVNGLMAIYQISEEGEWSRKEGR